MTFEPGDIVKVGAGFIDWEVVGSTPARRVLLRSGMTGRHCSVDPDNINIWRPHER